MSYLTFYLLFLDTRRCIFYVRLLLHYHGSVLQGFLPPFFLMSGCDFMRVGNNAIAQLCCVVILCGYPKENIPNIFGKGLIIYIWKPSESNCIHMLLLGGNDYCTNGSRFQTRKKIYLNYKYYCDIKNYKWDIYYIVVLTYLFFP